MSPAKRKVVHSVGVALVGVLTDVGAQLANGSVNIKRAVIVGLVVGGLARLLGAFLAATASETPPTVGPGNG